MDEYFVCRESWGGNILLSESFTSLPAADLFKSTLSTCNYKRIFIVKMCSETELLICGKSNLT